MERVGAGSSKRLACLCVQESARYPMSHRRARTDFTIPVRVVHVRVELSAGPRHHARVRER